MKESYNKNGQYPNPDLVGDTFGRLNILKWMGKNNHGVNMWLCQCSCNNKAIIRQDGLISGDTKSCGCLRLETHTKHGYCTTKEMHTLYATLSSMKQRCYNKNNKQYKYYGERGIKVYDEWLDSYKTFIEWGIKSGFKEGLTIERIDNDGDYTPENCCFADYISQANNKSSNHYLTYNGKTQSMAKWSREFGLKYERLKNRIYRGWSIEDALLKPLDTTRFRKDLK